MEHEDRLLKSIAKDIEQHRGCQLLASITITGLNEFNEILQFILNQNKTINTKLTQEQQKNQIENEEQ